MPTKLETCEQHEIASCPWCALDEADRQCDDLRAQLEQERQRTTEAREVALQRVKHLEKENLRLAVEIAEIIEQTGWQWR